MCFLKLIPIEKALGHWLQEYILKCFFKSLLPKDKEIVFHLSVFSSVYSNYHFERRPWDTDCKNMSFHMSVFWSVFFKWSLLEKAWDTDGKDVIFQLSKFLSAISNYLFVHVFQQVLQKMFFFCMNPWGTFWCLIDQYFNLY